MTIDEAISQCEELRDFLADVNDAGAFSNDVRALEMVLEVVRGRVDKRQAAMPFEAAA